jgi:hypothetical protein
MLGNNFISVDRQQAMNSYGQVFSVGDYVKHDDKRSGEAKILSFEVDEESNEIKSHTDKGEAHIDFIWKEEEDVIRLKIDTGSKS